MFRFSGDPTAGGGGSGWVSPPSLPTDHRLLAFLRRAPPVGAGQQAAIQFSVTPTRGGTKQLIVNFTCDRFPDVKAFETVEVAS